jgi:hypothetical protein
LIDVLKMRTRQETPARPATAAAEAEPTARSRLAVLDGTLVTLSKQFVDLGLELKRREAKDEHKGADLAPHNQTNIDALELICAAGGEPARPKRGESYRSVFDRRAATQKAISILEQERGAAVIRAAVERLEEHKPELDEAWKRICSLVIELERELQGKAEIVRVVGAPFPLDGESFTLLGRVAISTRN